MSMYNYQCDENYHIIKDVSQNYPQLTTYEKEWLYFARNEYNPGKPVDLEYQTIQTNDTATVLNAIPYQYKSAILKGKTDENLQSVKMPVLTTTGKNLFDEINGNFKAKNSIDDKTGEIKYYPSHVGVFQNYIPVKPNTTYTLSGQLTDGNNPVFRIAFYQKDKAFNKSVQKYVSGKVEDNRTSYNFTTSENDHYIRFSFGVMIQGYFQLEEGSKATEYEPYQSNILTCNEEVTLRRIGNVQDELNLITGELTERIGEVNSKELRVNSRLSIGTYANVISVNYDAFYDGWINQYVCSNKLNTIDRADMTWDKKSSIGSIAVNVSGFWFIVDKTIETVEQANEYLQNLDATIQYRLKTESVKTVDLSSLLDKPFEGTNHYQVSSDTINPTLVAEVPIVSEGEQTLAEINQATYQNL